MIADRPGPPLKPLRETQIRPSVVTCDEFDVLHAGHLAGLSTTGLIERARATAA